MGRSEFINQHNVSKQPLSISNLGRSIKDDLTKLGVSIIHGFPMDGFDLYNELAQLIITKPMTYTGGNNSREDIGAGALSVGTEPPEVDVAAHNEMSYWYQYPEVIMFGCKQSPNGRGPTVIANNYEVTKDILSTTMGQKFKTLGVKYIRNFYDQNAKEECRNRPSLRSWQDAFSCESKTEMTKICQDKQWDYQFSTNDDLTIAYKMRAFEFDPALNENLFFVTIGCHGCSFDHWAPFNKLENGQRPYHITFGDDTELTSEDIVIFQKILDKHSIPIFWETGKILVLDNRRYTHARPPFRPDPDKPRVIGVKIGNPVDRSGIQPSTPFFSQK